MSIPPVQRERESEREIEQGNSSRKVVTRLECMLKDALHKSSQCAPLKHFVASLQTPCHARRERKYAPGITMISCHRRIVGGDSQLQSNGIRGVSHDFTYVYSETFRPSYRSKGSAQVYSALL